MAEKKEQLRLTKSRLQTLNERIGKNIINSFQKTDQKNAEDEEQIELILEEANAYNLREEVKIWAEKELEKASFKGIWLSKLDAYVRAYHEWIK
jgi:S-adenosylmethionine/arginine decarboxylase-like enzyme